MSHDELLTRIKEGQWVDRDEMRLRSNALRAIVELHTPMEAGLCEWCTCRDCQHLVDYPCKTIQKIEKELQ